MITLHFHLIPQYKYELFHIYFTWFHCTGRNELNKLTLLPMCGFIAQLVEHRTGIAEVMGSNPVEALIFFRLLLSNCLNWKIYCDDHTSLSIYSWVAQVKLPRWKPSAGFLLNVCIEGKKPKIAGNFVIYPLPLSLCGHHFVNVSQWVMGGFPWLREE